ncbi:DUF2914 domain-containing protein [Rheinheimera sp.]|uniref:DUF2914 domain-containing protein n=1 Tax=Rheinheimera sp. TaxID=1869214 RepID=UPI0027B911D4|nr:DUF2914 domain-containing protein [Rheinheimera sp.]
MSESAAKLRVKVTLHRDLPVEPMPQLKRAKTSTSKLKLMLLLAALVAAGFWAWQQLNNSKAMAEQAVIEDVVASSDVPDTELAAKEAEPAALQQKEETAPAENDIQPQGNTSNSVESGLNHNDVQLQLVAADNSAAVTATQTAAPETPQADAESPLVQTATANSKPDTNVPDTTASGIKLPEGFSRIVLVADMEQLEPGAPVAQLVAKKDIQRLYLFTELKGYAGQQLKHRWSFNGVVQTEALLTIEDSPWRTYSEKWLLPDQLGAWRVEIIDQQQNVLYSHDFQYQ